MTKTIDVMLAYREAAVLNQTKRARKYAHRLARFGWTIQNGRIVRTSLIETEAEIAKLYRR
jgi:hypothetical protein